MPIYLLVLDSKELAPAGHRKILLAEPAMAKGWPGGLHVCSKPKLLYGRLFAASVVQVWCKFGASLMLV